MQAYEPHFEVLAQKALSLAHGPVDAGLGDGDLGVEGVGDGGEEVEELADCRSSY